MGNSPAAIGQDPQAQIREKGGQCDALCGENGLSMVEFPIGFSCVERSLSLLQLRYG